ncbi:hypothetical protein [Hydrogenimonas sp.]
MTPGEIEAIKRHFKAFYEGDIYLFGSRVGRKKRGGDIDLFLDVAPHADPLRRKIAFLAALKRRDWMRFWPTISR